ncbi:Grx4 family monothiol glutaredoxin [Pseudomonas sp. LM13]
MQVLDTEARIRQQLAEHPVLLYMKGTADAPECGFSRAAVAALKNSGRPFATVNVLLAPHIREKLPKISQWPTYPQLFLRGELVGGCDIILGLEADGSLAAQLDAALAPET